MFFSKITLKKQALSLQKLAHIANQDNYFYHQLIWDLFSEDSPDKKRDFLYRTELAGHWPSFYVISHTEPYDKNQLWDIKVKSFQPKLTTHQRLHFKLCANPRITRKATNGKPQYFDIVQNTWFQNKDKINQGLLNKNELMQATAAQWLKRKATQHGFKVEAAIVENFQRLRLSNKKHSIRFSTLDFIGALTITNPELFHHALINGIGSAKGFGCGLLMVKP